VDCIQNFTNLSPDCLVKRLIIHRGSVDSVASAPAHSDYLTVANVPSISLPFHPVRTSGPAGAAA
jgi:hypothetical protein